MTPIRIMAGVTFREAARKRILWMALAGGCAFLILFAIALHFQMDGLVEHHAPVFLRKQVLNNALLLGLYALDMLAVVLTVIASVDTLSGEIESGTLQAIATKPVYRWQLLAGKWFGFAAMLVLYLLIMAGGLNLVAYIISGTLVRHFAQGFGLICMESALLLSLTFFFGATFSTLTNGVLVLGLHGMAFLGGWIEQAGALTHTPQAVAVGVVASILMPSESLWRRAAFEMQSPVVSALNVTPFSGMSVPSGAMIIYAALYIAGFLILAMLRLERRDL